MRILVISDTHGKHDNLDKVLEAERPYDRIIHLGDAEGAEDYIAAVGECPLDIVRGNNDFFSELPEEEILELEGHRLFITHGHYYYVAAGTMHLIREGHGRGADIVFYGHTHRPEITKDKELYVVNPGSLSYPRQENRRPSYVILNLAENQEPEFVLKYL